LQPEIASYDNLLKTKSVFEQRNFAQRCSSLLLSSSIALRCSSAGLPGPDGQKMPNRFKKCQTNRNRLIAVGFELPG